MGLEAIPSQSIVFGLINVALSGNSISGDPVTTGVISGVSTSATAVFDITLNAEPQISPDLLYSIDMCPLGTSNLTWAVTNLTASGFTVTFRNAATGAAASPSAGFTASVTLVL